MYLLWHIFPSWEREKKERERESRAQSPPLCSKMFFFVVFEPRIVNPPLPLVFMQNHPFIPRYACLTAISCPPTFAPLSRPFPILFGLHEIHTHIHILSFSLLSCSYPSVYFNNAAVLFLSGRPREICLSISRQPRVNQHPLTPAGRPPSTGLFFFYRYRARFRYSPSPLRRCRSYLTYRQLTEMKGRWSSFLWGNLEMRASRLITIQIDSRQL